MSPDLLVLRAKVWPAKQKSDLQAIGVEDWLNLTQNRSLWHKTCANGVEQQGRTVNQCVANRQLLEGGSTTNHQCSCGRVFRQKGDLTRHCHFLQF